MNRAGSDLVARIVFAMVLVVSCSTPNVESVGGGGRGGMPGTSTGGAAGSPDAGFGWPPPPTGTGGAAGGPGSSVPPEGEKPCAAQAFTAEKVPVDMHILFDSSLSMGRPAGNRSKWDRAVEAMNSFIMDPKSAGLGVGLTFFPNRTPTNVNTCRLDYYTTPAVTIAPLPMNASPLIAAINGRQLCCDTPTRPGMEGALGYLRTRAALNRDHRAIFLLITDGLPNGCGPDNTVPAIADFLRAARAATPSITTYAIGVFGDEDRAEGEPVIRSWAMAGGGGTPFVLSATDDLGQKLLDALNEIRGAVVACQFAVPTMPGIDFSKVNVRVQSNGGTEEVPYVRTADRCDPVKGGWYYDVDPTTPGAAPTRVIICEATCNRYKPDAKAKVDLLFGCKTRTIE